MSISASDTLNRSRPDQLNDRLRGYVGKFGLDALVALAARAGLTVAA